MQRQAPSHMGVSTPPPPRSVAGARKCRMLLRHPHRLTAGGPPPESRRTCTRAAGGTVACSFRRADDMVMILARWLLVDTSTGASSVCCCCFAALLKRRGGGCRGVELACLCPRAPMACVCVSWCRGVGGWVGSEARRIEIAGGKVSGSEHKALAHLGAMSEKRQSALVRSSTDARRRLGVNKVGVSQSHSRIEQDGRPPRPPRLLLGYAENWMVSFGGIQGGRRGCSLLP